MNEVLSTGTTTVAIVVKDAVVLATDRRVTADHFIAHKDGKKLHKLDTYAAMTIAGLVGDAQVLVRYMRAELELYRLQRKFGMPIEAGCNATFQYTEPEQVLPFMVQLIVAGYDTAPHIFSIDAAGGAVEDTYVSTGSGSPFVYGVLETEYTKDMKIDEGIDLVIKSVSASKQRDSASGGMIDVAVIDAKVGYKDVPEEEVLDRIKETQT